MTPSTRKRHAGRRPAAQSPTLGQFRRALRSYMLVALALGAALSAPGCKSGPTATATTPNQRTAEAYNLSVLAQKAQQEGKTDQAIDLYRRAVELQPNLPGAWNNLGNLLLEKKVYLDAVEAFRREAGLSANQNQPDPRPYTNIGVAYSRAGFADRSLGAYMQALDRDPNWLDALRGVALEAKRLNRADEKIDDALKRALMLEKDPAWRTMFETERLRVEGQLREQKENDRSRGGRRY